MLGLPPFRVPEVFLAMVSVAAVDPRGSVVEEAGSTLELRTEEGMWVECCPVSVDTYCNSFVFFRLRLALAPRNAYRPVVWRNEEKIILKAIMLRPSVRSVLPLRSNTTLTNSLIWDVAAMLPVGMDDAVSRNRVAYCSPVPIYVLYLYRTYCICTVSVQYLYRVLYSFSSYCTSSMYSIYIPTHIHTKSTSSDDFAFPAASYSP